MDDSPDRDAILARRARFVATAVAAFQLSTSAGCASSSSDDGAHPTTSVELSAGPSTTSSATPAVSASSNAASGTWADVLATRPPLTASDSLPANERTEIASLSQQLAPIYDEIGKVWETPSCKLPDKSCEDVYANVARLVARYREGLRGPLCGFMQGAGYIQRHTEHSAFIAGLVKELSERMARASRSAKPKEYWPSLVESSAPPYPCLDCAMPSEPALGGGSPVAVPFEVGVSSLGRGADAELQRALNELKGATDVYEIRGHIDSGEAPELAKQRAEAVHKWLVDHGVAANKLLVTSYADSLPIGAQTPAGRAKNRRVDFEAPTKRRR